MGSGDKSPFTFNLRRAQIFGWWKIDSESFSKQIAYGIFRLFSLLWLSLFTAFQLLDLYKAVASLEKFSTNVCGTSVSVVSVFKTFAVLYKSRLVDDLHFGLTNNLHIAHVGRDEADRRIVARGGTEIVQLTKIFFGLVIPTIFGWSVMPLIDRSEEMRLPLRLWIPYDWHSSPAYELFYLYQVVGLWLFAVNILSQDLIFFGFIIQICSQYEILEKNLRRINRFCYASEVEEQALVEDIKRSILHHQAILERIRQIQTIYNESFSVHFSGALPLLCVIGFNIINEGKKKGMTTLMMSQIGYVGSTLFDIFFFCFFGERLRQKGTRIAGAVYESLWYRMGYSSRKLLITFMARAQNSPGLRASNIININLRWFLWILRNCYNIIAVMNQTSRADLDI